MQSLTREREKGYWPWNAGRLPRLRAAMPAWWSWLTRHASTSEPNAGSSGRATIRFIAVTASGALSAISRARSTTMSDKSLSGTTSVTRPIRSASRAS